MNKSIIGSRRLKQHWTTKKGKMVPKIAFKTLDECLDYIKAHHIKDIYHPYVCRECGMWHIGHSKKHKQL